MPTINFERAETYTGPLASAKCEQITGHLKALPEATRDKAVAQLVANGGPEGAFVRHLLGHAAPENRKARPTPETK